jgi:hypothetical protein
LGRRKRKDARVVDAARGQLSTAEINARAVLATVMTQIELPASRVLEERERLQASTETAIENSYDLVTGSTTDPGSALEQLEYTGAIVTEGTEPDRLEPSALGEHPASPARHDEHTADPWCWDNSHWIRGVEIAHVSNENDTIRYWLRRKSDGYIIPGTFDVNDVCFLPEVPTRSAATHAADTEVEMEFGCRVRRGRRRRDWSAGHAGS